MVFLNIIHKETNKIVNFDDDILKLSTLLQSLISYKSYAEEPLPLFVSEKIYEIFVKWFDVVKRNYLANNLTYKIYYSEIFEKLDLVTLIEIFHFGITNQINLLFETVAYVIANKSIKIKLFNDKFYTQTDDLVNIDGEIYFKSLFLDVTLVTLILKYSSDENFLKLPDDVKEFVKDKKYGIDNYNKDNDFNYVCGIFKNASYDDMKFLYELWKSKFYQTDKSFKENFKKCFEPDSEVVRKYDIKPCFENKTFSGDFGFHNNKFAYYNEKTSKLDVVDYDFTFKNFATLFILNEIEITDSFKSYVLTHSQTTQFEKQSHIKNAINAPVMKIGRAAFSYFKNLTSIEIPDNILSLGPYAFNECHNLSSIEIPDSVFNIDFEAFGRCLNLTSIKFPTTLKVISEYLCNECVNLSTVEIPDSVTKIKQHAFSNCIRLNSIKLSSNLKEILYGAFSECESLDNVIIPNSVTFIDNNVFECCKSLKNITLSNKLSFINDGMFMCCLKLSNIEIPESVQEIKYDVFYGCTSLEKINIPNTVTYIESSAFNRCESLYEVKLPNSIHSLNEYTFKDCYNLNSIEIPNSVTKIGNFCFENCEKLLYLQLPNNLKQIGKKCFRECYNLQTFTIPTTVTSIGYKAFSGCNRNCVISNYDFKEDAFDSEESSEEF